MVSKEEMESILHITAATRRFRSRWSLRASPHFAFAIATAKRNNIIIGTDTYFH